MTAIYWLGAHKTATTFLQKSLDTSHEALAEHGVKYIELDEFRDKYTRPLLDQSPPHPPAPSEFLGDEPTKLVFDENIIGYVQHALSPRGFYPDAVVRTRAIADHLDLPPDELVFGIRKYEAFLPSLYCETLKSTPFKTFDDYLRHSFAGSVGFERMNWHVLLRSLMDAWPDMRVRVFFHEDLRGNEAALLATVLDLPDDAIQTITTTERIGFSGHAVAQLHAIAAEREVEREDVHAAVRMFPTGPDHPTFRPWKQEEKARLRASYARDKAAILADPAIEVIPLAPAASSGATTDDEADDADTAIRHGAAPADAGRAGPVPDLSVVIPVHDAQDSIRRVAESFLTASGLDVELVLVDDHSTDDSGAIIDELAAAPNVVAVHHDRNLGAGVARNTGFPLARGRYCLFFDADDIVHPDALVTAVAGLDRSGADVAVMAYHYKRVGTSAHTGMNTFDVATWERYLEDAPERVGSLAEMPSLLGISNYPWNKVVRTDTYRRTGLRFGSTPVHNDILGHWQTLLYARNVLLLADEVCTHVVTSGAANLTNQHSAIRLTLFDALDETYDFLLRHPDLRNRYSHHYWSMVLRVATWAGGRIANEHRPQFNRRLQDHLLRANLADFARMRMKRDPELADEILRKALA